MQAGAIVVRRRDLEALLPFGMNVVRACLNLCSFSGVEFRCTLADASCLVRLLPPHPYVALYQSCLSTAPLN